MAGIAVLAPSARALAADHYVLASATGAGTGADWTNAYTCIPADAALVRGDIYYIGPGDYRNCDGAAARTFTTPANGQRIVFRRAVAADHGTAGDWNAAWGAGQAIFHPLRFLTNDWTLDGQTRGDLRSGYLIRVINQDANGVPYNTTGSTWVLGSGSNTAGRGGTAASNITFQYVEVIGTRNLAAPILTENGISIFGQPGSIGGPASNVYIGYNSITLPGNSNVSISGAANVTEEHNWLAYNKSTSSSHAEGNAITGSVSNITISYNVFEDMEGTAFVAFPNSTTTAPSNIYIYGNVFMRSLDNPQNIAGAIGNGIVAVLSNANANGLYVYNNTIVNQQAGITGSPRLFTVSHNSTNGNGTLANFYAENNLWYSNSGMDNSSAPCTYCSGSYVWDHNAYFDTTAAADTDPNKQSGSGSPFINYSAKNFHLAFATAAGATLVSPFNTDTSGAARGADGVWDRGAYEFSGGSTPPPPPPSDTTPPSVPAGLTAAAESTTQINLSWTASTDNVGVTGYKIYRGSVQIGTSASASYADTGLAAATTYVYTVAAYDAAGNVSAQSASVSATTKSAPASTPVPDTTPPTISLTAPASGATVSSTIAVSASASDNVGVAKVEFYLDNVLQAAGTASPYTWSWNTTAAANGSHSLSAKAYDAAGNIGTSGNVSVTVANASQTGSSTTTTATTTTTPPSTSFQILSIGVSQVTDTSAVITLTTNQPASVVLNYGPTTNYGQATLPSPSLMTIYENLTGLTPATVYDFQAVATPAGTNTQVTSPNYVFATQPASAPPPSQTPLSSGSGGGGGAGSGSSGGGAYVPPPSSGSESPSGGTLGTGSSSGTAPPSPAAPSLPPVFPRNLMLEDTGSDVTLLQTLLQSMDYFPPAFTPTTYFGSMTQHALLLFQRDHQLNRSGFLDLQSQVLLNKVAEAQGIGGSTGTEANASSSASTGTAPTAPATATPFTRYLTVGASGPDVILLQQLLIKDNDYPEGIVSGYFGQLTQAAVRRFQAKYGIVSSGTPATTGYGAVGPRTRGRMNAQ